MCVNKCVRFPTARTADIMETKSDMMVAKMSRADSEVTVIRVGRTAVVTVVVMSASVR